jgi:hypothetical protein
MGVWWLDFLSSKKSQFCFTAASRVRFTLARYVGVRRCVLTIHVHFVPPELLACMLWCVDKATLHQTFLQTPQPPFRRSRDGESGVRAHFVAHVKHIYPEQTLWACRVRYVCKRPLRYILPERIINVNSKCNSLLEVKDVERMSLQSFVKCSLMATSCVSS